jgi:transposase
MGYSIDFRKKLFEFLSKGHTMREARDAFGVSLTTVNNWKRKLAKTGDLADAPKRRSFKKIDPDKLKAYIAKHPDAYLSEVAEAIGCCASAVRKAFFSAQDHPQKKPKNTGNRSRSK